MTSATTYGFDISHYQAQFHGDFASAQKQGYLFAMLKCTEGTGYVDPAYPQFLGDIKANGYLGAAYHFLTNGNGRAQARFFADHVKDPHIGIMIDLEAYGAAMDDAEAFRSGVRDAGLKGGVSLYLPHWYWQRIGSPSLKGWHLVSSEYPSSAHRLGSALYPGNQGGGWDAYGGVVPTIWQFASSGLIQGYPGNVDLDAFRGTRKDLAATGLFKDYAPTPPTVPPLPPATHTTGPARHTPAPAPAPAPRRTPNWDAVWEAADRALKHAKEGSQAALDAKSVKHVAARHSAKH